MFLCRLCVQQCQTLSSHLQDPFPRGGKIDSFEITFSLSVFNTLSNFTSGCSLYYKQNRDIIKLKTHLVDLIHHSEGAAVKLLQGHQIKHGGNAALSSALMVRCELMELRAAVELHTNANPVLVVFLLKESRTVNVILFNQNGIKSSQHSSNK